MHTNTAMKHEQAKKRVCFGCFKKVKFGETINASPLLRDRVQRLVPYVLSNDNFPVGICSSCRLRLGEFERGVLQSFDTTKLEELSSSLTRTSPRNECKCTVCVAAGGVGLDSRRSIKTGRPKEEEEEEQHLCCPKCFSQIYRGCAHKCNPTTLLNNILEKVPESVKQRVASSVVKAVAEEKGTKEVTLKTGGTPLSVTMGPAPKKQKLSISHEAVDELQDHSNLTDRQTLQGLYPC